MTLKLSPSEFKALYEMLNAIVRLTGIHPLGDEGLQHTVMLAIRLKFYHAADIVRKKYKVKLSAAEQQAFWLWFNEHEYANDSQQGNLLNQICYNIYMHFDTQINPLIDV